MQVELAAKKNKEKKVQNTINSANSLVTNTIGAEPEVTLQNKDVK